MHGPAADATRVLFGLPALWVATLVLIVAYGVIMTDKLKVAFPLMVISIVVAHVYLYLRYL